MRKAWTVAAAAALLFAGVALSGCKCGDDAGASGGAAASACADCKAAGGQCAKCAAAAKPAEPAK